MAGKDKEMNDQLRVRREKMNELREEGIDPFGHRFERTYLAAQLHEEFGDDDMDELNDLPRLRSLRVGWFLNVVKVKLVLLDLQDRTGKMQIYVRKDILGDEVYHIFKRSDIGDHLGIEGDIIKTDMGELTIRATKLTFLSKALRPLPDKFHGLQNKEQIYRQRYLI